MISEKHDLSHSPEAYIDSIRRDAAGRSRRYTAVKNESRLPPFSRRARSRPHLLPEQRTKNSSLAYRRLLGCPFPPVQERARARDSRGERETERKKERKKKEGKRQTQRCACMHIHIHMRTAGRQKAPSSRVPFRSAAYCRLKQTLLKCTCVCVHRVRHAFHPKRALLETRITDGRE